ncbi:MAG: hypothetical protein WBC06_06265, partial [Chitinophagaceae bacterium]
FYDSAILKADTTERCHAGLDPESSSGQAPVSFSFCNNLLYLKATKWNCETLSFEEQYFLKGTPNIINLFVIGKATVTFRIIEQHL